MVMSSRLISVIRRNRMMRTNALLPNLHVALKQAPMIEAATAIVTVTGATGVEAAAGNQRSARMTTRTGIAAKRIVKRRRLRTESATGIMRRTSRGKRRKRGREKRRRKRRERRKNSNAKTMTTRKERRRQRRSRIGTRTEKMKKRKQRNPRRQKKRRRRHPTKKRKQRKTKAKLSQL